jgi:hypothetical protein
VKTRLANAAKVMGMVILVVVPGGSLVLLVQALLRGYHRRVLAAHPA